MKWLRAGVVVAVLLAVAGGAVAGAEKAAELRARADAHLKAGRVKEAVLDLRSAVQADPTDQDHQERLGDVLWSDGQREEAFRVYLDVVSRDPHRYHAGLRVAAFYLWAGRFEDAEVYARRVAEDNPADPASRAVLAKALAGLKRWEDAAAALGGAVELAPRQFSLRVALVRLHLMREDFSAAEKTLRKAAADFPEEAAPRRMLAALLVEQEQYQEADRLMRELEEEQPEDAAGGSLSALYWVKRGDYAAAEEHLKKVLALAGDDQGKRAEALEMLALFYADRGRLKDLEGAVEQLRSTDPASRLASLSLANLRLLQGRVEEAEKILAGLEGAEGASPAVRLLQARARLRAGAAQEARELLAALVEEGAAGPEVYYHLGRAQRATGEPDKARWSWLKVVEAEPGHFFANLALARESLRLGRGEEALGYARVAWEANPEYPGVADVWGEALLAAGKGAEAEAVYSGLLEKGAAERFLVLFRLGQAAEAQGEEEKALKLYADSSAAQPGFVDATLWRMRLLARRGEVAGARRVGAGFLAEHGENPLVLNQLAELAARARDLEGAAGLLARSVAAAPELPETRELQARVLMARGDVDGARAALAAAREAAPGRVQTLVLLGALEERAGNRTAARDLYREVLRLDPENLTAANNLAMLLLAGDEHLGEALRLAQLVADRSPESALAQDTVGWATYRNGQHALAVTHLERAHRALPENAEVTYHLGMAYLKTGKPEQAVALLRAALDAPRKGEWAFEASQGLQEAEAAVE